MTPVEASCRNRIEEERQDRMVLEELPQVYYLARRIHERLPRHVPLEDLVHAGVLGLIAAFRNFDVTKNVQFKSFAQFRIRGAILDSLRELDWGSRRLRRSRRSIDDAISRLAGKLGRGPEEDEIASELGIQLTTLHKLLGRLDGLDLRNQQTKGGVDHGESLDLVENARAPAYDSPFHQCLHAEITNYLGRAISSLAEKEQQVVSLYYREERTMKEIAIVLGVVESRVSQLHTAALAKLRTVLEHWEIEGVNELTTGATKES